MDEVYAWVEDQRAANQVSFRRLLEQGRRKWTPTGIMNRCCVKWLMDGSRQFDQYDDFIFDEYNVRAGCEGQRKCKREHPCVMLGYDTNSRATIATLSHKLDPFLNYFDGLVAEGKAAKLPHSVYSIDGYLRPNLTALKSHNGFGNHLISIEKGALDASDKMQMEELETKESVTKKPRTIPPTFMPDSKPAAVKAGNDNSTKSEFSDDDVWTEEDFAKIDQAVANEQAAHRIADMFDEVMTIVLNERLQNDLENDFVSLYAMRGTCKTMEKMAESIASHKLKTLDLYVTPLVNGMEQYGEWKIDGYDSESWDAMWQMWGEPTDVYRYDKRAKVKLAFDENGENGPGYYPTDDVASTFSWNSGPLSLDAEEEEDQSRSDSADYAYRGQLMRLHWHPTNSDPVKGRERGGMYGEGKPSLGIRLASFFILGNPTSAGAVSKTQNDTTIDYEVLECNTSRTEDGTDDEIEQSIEYSGKIRIAKIKVDFGVLVREHALKIKRDLGSRYASIQKERPLTQAEKEYEKFIDLKDEEKHQGLAKSLRMIDDSDMDMLRKRVEKQETQYVKLLIEQTKYFSRENDDEDAEEKLPLPEAVYIILFLPETPEQHVHTIEFPKGSGTNILLAFEDENECKSFADMLVRDMGFEDPCPEETAFEPLAQYCEAIGIPLAIVPDGFELTPPQLNSDEEDEDEELEPIIEDKSFENNDSPNNKTSDPFDDADAWQ